MVESQILILARKVWNEEREREKEREREREEKVYLAINSYFYAIAATTSAFIGKLWIAVV